MVWRFLAYKDVCEQARAELCKVLILQQWRDYMSVRGITYFSLLACLVFASLAWSGCTKPYYSRSFEENQIRRVAEQAEAFHQQAQNVEAEIKKENQELQGAISQISYVNSQARAEAGSSRRSLEKLKVKNLPPVPLLEMPSKSPDASRNKTMSLDSSVEK